MKTGLVILLMISLVSCIKSDTFYKKLKYMTYKEFKENYFYSYDEHNMLVPSGFSLITIDNTLLLKFLKEKARNLHCRYG